MTSPIETPRPERPKSPLRHLHDTQRSVEKFRIQLSNRVAAITMGADEMTAEVPPIYRELADMALGMEEHIDKSINRELRNWPVWEVWLSHVKGIGPGLGGQLLAMLLPPIPEKGPSSWYKAAGLDPSLQADGTMRLPRPRAGGGKITYYPWLRRCLNNVAESFVRSGGYYREVYEQRKERLVATHNPRAHGAFVGWRGAADKGLWLRERFATEDLAKAAGAGVTTLRFKTWAEEPTLAKAWTLADSADDNWPLIRVERVARWVTVKLFLAHLWEMWSEVEGLPARRAYVIDVLGHDSFIPAPRWEKGEGKL